MTDNVPAPERWWLERSESLDRGLGFPIDSGVVEGPEEVVPRIFRAYWIKVQTASVELNTVANMSTACSYLDPTLYRFSIDYCGLHQYSVFECFV